MTNEEKGLLSRLKKEVRSKSQKCYNPSCDKLAIRSHIHQAEGPIRRIANVEGKIVQIEDLDPNFNSTTWGFKEKGIKQKGDVLTYWGFCSKCDTKIFKEIENESVDYLNYRNQILYSYRGYLSELYKQEYNLKWYEKIFESNKLSEQTKKSFHYNYLNFLLSVKSGRSTKKLLESDLNGDTKNFEFLSFRLPKIEVCTSTSYALPTAIKINDTLMKDLEIRETFPPISSDVFVNLIPTPNNLEVILGCHNDKKLSGGIDLKKVSILSQKDKIKLISDILIRHIETWFVSKSLFKLWKNRKMDTEILRQMDKYKPAHMKSKHVKFNMFHDIIK